MGSSSKQKTTMAKLARERALRERRELKQAKKQARRQAAVAPPVAAGETPPPEPPSDVHLTSASSGPESGWGCTTARTPRRRSWYSQASAR